MPFGKILRSRFGKRDSHRQIDTPRDLLGGDLVSFKHRLVLPPELQGKTLELTSIATYEYDDGIYPQLTLDGESGERVYLVFKASSPRALMLSRVVPRRDVVRLFDEEKFGRLWDDGFSELELLEALPNYDGWIGERYVQTKNSSEGYYHDRDCRGVEIKDDEGEEFRAHQCEDSSGRFGISVEIFGDGETEVSVEVNCDADVIESMWPGDAPGK